MLAHQRGDGARARACVLSPTCADRSSSFRPATPAPLPLAVRKAASFPKRDLHGCMPALHKRCSLCLMLPRQVCCILSGCRLWDLLECLRQRTRDQCRRFPGNTASHASKAILSGSPPLMVVGSVSSLH